MLARRQPVEARPASCPRRLGAHYLEPWRRSTSWCWSATPNAASESLGCCVGRGITRWRHRTARPRRQAMSLPGFDALMVDLGWPDLDLARLREALAPEKPAEPESLEQAERRHIAFALRHTDGNKRRAAQLLGISRSTLLHKVRKYGLTETRPCRAGAHARRSRSRPSVDERVSAQPEELQDRRAQQDARRAQDERGHRGPASI